MHTYLRYLGWNCHTAVSSFVAI